jgi:DNA-binding MarR family transcriptional regulator
MSDNSFSFDRADDSSGFLLWQVTTLWQRGIKKALTKHNITHAQFVLLASLLWLSKQEQEVMQIDLSSHSKIDPMTTSTVLRTLQSKGFVARQEHATDTRAKVVVLTPKGIAITKQAIKTVEQFDKEFFSILGGRQQEFNKLLVKLTTSS